MQLQELVTLLERGERQLRPFAMMDRAILLRSYAPGKWNGFQLLAHIADTDLVLYYRFLKAIGEEGCPVVPFDQDRWVQHLSCTQRPQAVSMAMIMAVGLGFVHHLSTLPTEALHRKTRHPERGEIIALDLASLAAKHALHHLDQLEAIRDGRTWAPA
jgi:hypothetical protein